MTRAAAVVLGYRELGADRGAIACAHRGLKRFRGPDHGRWGNAQPHWDYKPGMIVFTKYDHTLGPEYRPKQRWM